MAYGASPWGPYPPPYAVGHGPPGDYGLGVSGVKFKEANGTDEVMLEKTLS